MGADEEAALEGHGVVGQGLTWRRLAIASGGAAAAAVGVASVALGDLEGAAVTFVFVASTVLLGRGRGTVGAVGLTLVSAISLVFMLAAAVTHARSGSGLGVLAFSSGLASLSFLGLVSGASCVFARNWRADSGPLVSVVLAAATFVGMVGWGAATGEVDAMEADLQLVSENVNFSENVLRTIEGPVSVSLENRDLFWHTFTVEELEVDLRVPVGATLTDEFEAPPGMYEFICAIPGHPEAGMVGTLVVEAQGE